MFLYAWTLIHLPIWCVLSTYDHVRVYGRSWKYKTVSLSQDALRQVNKPSESTAPAQRLNMSKWKGSTREAAPPAGDTNTQPSPLESGKAFRFSCFEQRRFVILGKPQFHCFMPLMPLGPSSPPSLSKPSHSFLPLTEMWRPECNPGLYLVFDFIF